MSDADFHSCLVNIPESSVSDEESVSSYKCLSSERRWKQGYDRSWSSDESKQPLLSETSTKSSFKQLTKQSQFLPSCSLSIPERYSASDQDEKSELSYNFSTTGYARWAQLQDRNLSASESEQPLLLKESTKSFKQTSRQSQLSLPKNFSDEESVSSYSCFSKSEGRWIQLQDSNRSASESNKPLLSGKPAKSSNKSSKKSDKSKSTKSSTKSSKKSEKSKSAKSSIKSSNKSKKPKSAKSSTKSPKKSKKSKTAKSSTKSSKKSEKSKSDKVSIKSSKKSEVSKPAKSSIKSSKKSEKLKSKVKLLPAAKIKKKSKKLATGAIGYMWRVLKSEPSEHETVKMLLGFPTGLLIAGCFFITVIQPLDLDPDYRNLAGSITALLMGVGYAFSIQVRCVVFLVLPIFFGKAGRTFIGAYAVIFLLAGPIDNIVTNLREMARSLTCLASLLANHTVAKWKLRLNPLKEAVEELQEEGFMISRVSQVVREAFAPLIREVEDKTEVEEMEADLKEVEKIIKEDKKNGPPVDAFSVAKINEKHSMSGKLSQAQAIQEQWEKKLDLRCEDVFGKAVIRCREWFGDLWDKCLNALWILGYVLCLPLKMTFFCQLVKIIPGALGLSCDSMDVVQPGLGETYKAAKEMIAEVADGLKVKLQYRLTGGEDSGPSLMTAEEIRAQTMHEFTSKSRWANLILLVVKRLVMCTFLFVFQDAYQYQKGFLTQYQHDNIYITRYFRRIDARRFAQGKKTLLPLKKTEKQVVIFPASLKMLPREKKQAKFSVLAVLFKSIMTAMIVYVDYLLVWIMDIIYRNSSIEYRQQGEHFVNVTVHGKGFMAEIVRMFLTALNSHHKLDSITTNDVCLPLAREPNKYLTAMVFVVHAAVIVFILLEAYGMRLRRFICAFFYRKREKRRVLYLYNEMLKKRKGYLRHMRHRVRKQVRRRKLKGQTNVLTALTMQFPRLCCCLRLFKATRESCLICKEPEGKTFMRCPTPGCNWGYCMECWKDIKYRCYACGGKSDGESGTDPDDETDDASDSDSVDLDDDERFLH